MTRGVNEYIAYTPATETQHKVNWTARTTPVSYNETHLRSDYGHEYHLITIVDYSHLTYLLPCACRLCPLQVLCLPHLHCY